MNAMTPKNDNWLDEALRALPTDVQDHGFTDRVMSGLHADEKRRRVILILASLGGIGTLMVLGGWRLFGMLNDVVSEIPSVDVNTSALSWDSIMTMATNLPMTTVMMIIIGLGTATLILGENR